MPVTPPGNGWGIFGQAQLLGETLGTVTLAVESTGDDGAIPGRPAVITEGDYSAYPFATMQAAREALPHTLTGVVFVNVGAGTFAGVKVSGLMAGDTTGVAGVVFRGTRTAAALASGDVSGTATSGTTTTLTKTGAGWAVGDLQGRILEVTGGTGAGEYVIATNTADTITIGGVAAAAFSATSVFALEDLATVVNTPAAGTNAIFVTASSAPVLFYDFRITYANGTGQGVYVNANVPGTQITAYRVVVDTAGLKNGFIAGNGGTLAPYDCGAMGTLTGAAFSAFGDTAELNYWRVFADGAVEGLRVTDQGHIGFASIGSAWIANATTGARMYDSQGGAMELKSVHFESCTTAISILQGVASLDDVDIDGATTTIVAEDSELSIDGLTGSGNASWGADLSQRGNSWSFAAVPTITGASGELTLDGTEATTWAVVLPDSSGRIAQADAICGSRVWVGAFVGHGWDYLVIALTKDKQGQTDKPDYDFTEHGLLFPQNDPTEIAYGGEEFSHRKKLGTAGYPHVHFVQTGATAPTFKIGYRWYNNGGLVPAGFTTITQTGLVFTYPGAGSFMQIAVFDSIAAPASETISSHIDVRLWRDDNDMAGDVLAKFLDIHFEIDTFGSGTAFAK